jgi:hypothetical protein
MRESMTKMLMGKQDVMDKISYQVTKKVKLLIIKETPGWS